MISQQETLNFMKTSKTAQAVQKLKDGDLKGALSIFSIFNYNFTREERRIMRIAYETLSGHGSFYQSLGINTGQMIVDATNILYDKYLNDDKINKVK